MEQNISSPIIYNFGCGDNKIDGAINVDINESLKPDVVMNFLQPLAIPDESVDSIYFFHVIEHIPKKFHSPLIEEFYRILKLGGKIIFSYPEFHKIATNYINDHKGLYEFWEATIYGRQLHEWDYHKALMDTDRFTIFLRNHGIEVTTVKAETVEDFNTILIGVKVERPPDYEKLLVRSIYGNS